MGLVVDEALLTVGLRIAAAGAEIVVDLRPDIPQVRAGPRRLVQVLVNLLSNAADAVEGRVERRITLSARTNGGRVLLTVTDTGPGVAAPIAHRIFDPFFTTKSGPDSSGKGGTGLGLSACKEIVEKHHGRIRVESTIGKGTAFVIRFPVATEAAKEKPAA